MNDFFHDTFWGCFSLPLWGEFVEKMDGTESWGETQTNAKKYILKMHALVF